MKVCIVLCFLATAILAQRKDYTGYQLLSVKAEHESDVTYLQQLQMERVELDFWLQVGSVGQRADIMTAPRLVQGLIRELEGRGMTVGVKMADVQEAVDWETENNRKIKEENKLKGVNFAFNEYHSTDEIHAYLDELAAQNDFVSVQDLGQSAEGRTIKSVTVGTGGKPVQFYDCQVHAREWIAAATCLYILNEVVTGDTGIKDKFDFVMIIPTNVDGYEYTRSTDRMWRKTRSYNQGSNCRGVDPNRNFDANHCGQGSSRDPCSDMYCGPSPFSEPCIAATRDLFNKQSNVAFAFSVHSYSQFLLSPYCQTNQLPKDFDEMDRTGKVMKSAIDAVHGKRYTQGSSANVMYVAAGEATDWYYDAGHVINSFTIELRPTQDDWNGFVLPASEIIPTGEETFAAILAASNQFDPRSLK